MNILHHSIETTEHDGTAASMSTDAFTLVILLFTVD